MVKKSEFLLLVALCFCILAGCGEKRPEDDPYSGGYNPDTLVTIIQDEGYPDIQFPVNQLVVYTENDVEYEDAVALFEDMEDVKLIGQVPSIGFYQLEVNASTTEELDSFKEILIARPEIKGATYNLLFSDSADIGSCPVHPDVNLPGTPEMDIEPYHQTMYFTALEIMQGLRDTLTLHPVTIGIFEDGYAHNREFNDITIENYSERNPSGRRIPLRRDEHGTEVAGIICGDNDGEGINGLASTLIGNRLRVGMARAKTNDFIDSCVAMASIVIAGNAAVINNSFIHGPFYDSSSDIARDIVAAYTEVMTRYPDVLFVNAAGNQGIELTGANTAPGGIRLDNTLTVSSWQHDDPSARVTGHNHGGLVDISAPGDMVAVVLNNGHVTWASGTSFATPMVTSAAALLKSIGGSSLSPIEIKTLLLDPSFHGERTEPGGGIQLSFAHPLVDLLWQEYQGTDWAELLLDSDDDDLHDIPEIVESTICSASGVTVDEFGTFSLDQHYPCNPGIAMFLGSDGTTWDVFLSHLTNNSNDELAGTLSGGPATFALNESYQFNDQNTFGFTITCDNLIDETDCTFEDPIDGDFAFNGSSTTGSFSFTRCSISERTSDGEPKYLSIDILFECSVHGWMTTYYPSDPVLPLDIEEMTTNAKGWVKNIRASTVDPFGTFNEYVEQVCSDGDTE